jgi:type I phosphodiesterase/nucleotide pyrophosphatase
MSRPVIVVVLVDALGWTLAGRDPAFAPLLRERRPLATVLGFSSGALPTAFTGRTASEHGRWLMYQRARGRGVFSGFGALRWLPRRVRESARLTRLLDRIVAGRGVRGYFNLYEVPREELPAFDLPERDDIFAPGGLPCDSLWDVLERRGVAWRGWNWRTPEPLARAQALEELTAGRLDFLFVYSAVLDARLHHEGSHGAGVQACLSEWSAWFEAAAAAATRAGREPWLYLCSDHGMVDVRVTVDVMARVDALPFRRGRDYLAFFDSTMARFWWRESRARDAVLAALAAEPRGRWLTAEERAREGVAFADARFGEDVFLLEPGALLVPSFMGRGPVAAMHGYDPAHPDMVGILAANRPLPADVTHLAHLKRFLERELDAARGERALGVAS